MSDNTQNAQEERLSRLKAQREFASEFLQRDSQLGKTPSLECLWQKCVELQAQVWEHEHARRTMSGAINRVAKAGLKRESELSRSNAEQLRQAFKQVPSGDPTDGLYTQRRVVEALKLLNMWQSLPTTKRRLKAAKERGIIPPFENEQMRLTREELWDFVQFLGGEK